MEAVAIGHVRELVRYPVKSMAGIPTESALLGWHGLPGDRRFAFRRLDSDSDFPWLTASRLPELLLYRPNGLDERDDPSPARVRTPEGANVELRSAELLASVTARAGSALELMRFKHGVFDDAAVSIISVATTAAVCKEAGIRTDTRRFRANIVVETDATEPFLEDGWVGGRLLFGSDDDGAIVSLTMHDVRCMMINLDPDTAEQDPGLLRAAVRLNGNNAGAYGAVVRTGRLTVGQEVTLLKA